MLEADRLRTDQVMVLKTACVEKQGEVEMLVMEIRTMSAVTEQGAVMKEGEREKSKTNVEKVKGRNQRNLKEAESDFSEHGDTEMWQSQKSTGRVRKSMRGVKIEDYF